ncbi:MAG: 50S ribosomal protein L4 [Candidatus Pacebacteria bacterium]|nr:50S ribosomal protein L4 [Candidatus Paceibacterota bacterium]
MKLQVVHTSGKNTDLEVSKDIFGVEPNKALLSQAVRVYLSNQRQGTAKVKTRSEVNKTKKKWYRQKGTGGARHGARTPNIFVGGGVSHGPNGEQNWSVRLSANQRRQAIISALSAQVKHTAIAPEIMKLSGKTKEAAKLFDALVKDAQHVLVVLHESTAGVLRATSNIERVLVTQATRLNVHETLLADAIFMTEEAVHMLEKRLSGQAETKTKPKIIEKKITLFKKDAEVAKPVAKVKLAEKKTAKPVKTVTKTAKTAKKAPKKKAGSK